MLKSERLYLKLSSISNGQKHELDSPLFTVEDFAKDWLKDKSRIWSSTLVELIEKTIKIKSEIEKSIKYQFTPASSFSKDTLDAQLETDQKYRYPKIESLLFDDIVIKNKEEEIHYKRQQNRDNLLASLSVQINELKSCLVFYEKERDSKIFEPDYPKKDRIPYQGGEKSLAFFMSLLIEGGFVLATPSASEGQKLVGLPDYINDSIKNFIVTKDQIANAIGQAFYCVEKDGEKSNNKSKITFPKSTNLSSKMQITTLPGKSEKARIITGFEKILNILSPSEG